MPLIDSATFECEKCDEYCEIDADGVRSVAWCYECEDYAQGFDGAEWFGEQAQGAADNLRKERNLRDPIK